MTALLAGSAFTTDGAWAFYGVVVAGVMTLVGSRLQRPRNARRAEAAAVEAADVAVGTLDRRIAAAEERTARAENRAERVERRAEEVERRAEELRRRAEAAERRADGADRLARECEAARQRNEEEIRTLHRVVAEQGLRLAVLIEAVERQVPGLDVAALLEAQIADDDRPPPDR